MANSLFKKVRVPLAGMASLLEKEQINFVQNNHKRKLEEIVEPFATPITFKLEKVSNGGSLIVQITPEHNTVQRRAGVPSSGTMDAYDLFFYLNDGTSVRHAKMPKGYENETFPNSTITASKSNDRSKIYVNKQTVNEPGLAARNWLALVEQEFQPNFVRRMTRTIAGYLRRV